MSTRAGNAGFTWHKKVLQSEHLATATPDSLHDVQTMIELTAANSFGSRFPGTDSAVGAGAAPAEGVAGDESSGGTDDDL